MNYRRYGLVLAALGLTACQARVPPATAHPAQNSRETPKRDAIAKAEGIESRLNKNMAYADLRVIALEGGWKPVVDTQCKSNVMGSNHEQLCSTSPDLDSCQICSRLPEVGSCSGDGYCGMTFSKNGQTFGITTYGMIEDWNVRGYQSRLNVLDWEFSK